MRLDEQGARQLTKLGRAKMVHLLRCARREGEILFGERLCIVWVKLTKSSRFRLPILACRRSEATLTTLIDNDLVILRLSPRTCLPRAGAQIN